MGFDPKKTRSRIATSKPDVAISVEASVAPIHFDPEKNDQEWIIQVGKDTKFEVSQETFWGNREQLFFVHFYHDDPNDKKPAGNITIRREAGHYWDEYGELPEDSEVVYMNLGTSPYLEAFGRVTGLYDDFDSALNEGIDYLAKVYAQNMAKIGVEAATARTSGSFWMGPNGELFDSVGEHDDSIMALAPEVFKIYWARRRTPQTPGKWANPRDVASELGWVRLWIRPYNILVDVGPSGDEAKVTWALESIPQEMRHTEKVIVDADGSSYEVKVLEGEDALDAWKHRNDVRHRVKAGLTAGKFWVIDTVLGPTRVWLDPESYANGIYYIGVPEGMKVIPEGWENIEVPGAVGMFFVYYERPSHYEDPLYQAGATKEYAYAKLYSLGPHMLNLGEGTYATVEEAIEDTVKDAVIQLKNEAEAQGISLA